MLAIVCPTRGRPELCRRMVDSALATTTLADVLLYVDMDDPEAKGYEPLAEIPRVRLMFGSPVGRGHAVNHLIAKTHYRAYLVVSDDITYVRPGWDLEVLKAMDAFGDDIGCVHLASENGHRYVNWACVSRKWIDTLGWFNQPSCGMFCQDTVIQILAEALGRITFIEPQVVQHDCLVGPQQVEKFHADTAVFLWYCAQAFGSDLAKLKAAMR